jgi:uncharacterized protein (TIGR03435 family)
LTVALPAVAQSQAFATITIKPARSADPRDVRVQLLPSGDLIARAVPAVRLFSYAYDVPVNGSRRLSPLPDWTVSERYDIEIKASANTSPPSLQDRSEVRTRMQQMIRELLIDRFKLVMRVENKTMPVYALAVASGGPKLQKSGLSDKECSFSTPEACHQFTGGLGHPLNGQAVDMDDVVLYIENWTDLPVVNGTALNGLFTLNTEGWLPMRLPPPPPNAAPAANPFAGLPTIFTVLGKLGLELNRREEMLSVYTVEHLERPTAN